MRMSARRTGAYVSRMGLVQAGHYPTDAVLQEIGKVVVAASTLEFVAAIHHPDGVSAASKPKAALLRELRESFAGLPAAKRERSERWGAEVESALNERDVEVHSWAYSPGLGVFEAPEWAVARRHPRTGRNRVDDEATLSALVRRLEDCIREAMRLTEDD